MVARWKMLDLHAVPLGCQLSRSRENWQLRFDCVTLDNRKSARLRDNPMDCKILLAYFVIVHSSFSQERNTNSLNLPLTVISTLLIPDGRSSKSNKKLT
ncbi:hypothetical protein CEXT_39691 [Caerostris extrusa]|uniref:Uncharacterized protein n=1 Tax=Caerostris extrusa TaxID=172846 RepID=A0AAV4MHK6_CAEEX|nr:hypothetical protein CEXT_39691 [Caerostris extrusa]